MRFWTVEVCLPVDMPGMWKMMIRKNVRLEDGKMDGQPTRAAYLPAGREAADGN